MEKSENMKFLSRYVCKLAFSIVCFSVLVVMVGYWAYKYHIEDRDIAVVEYVSLSTIQTHDMIPSPTICFKNPFIDENLKEAKVILNITQSGIDRKDYLDYLEGDRYDPIYNKIPFENVTLDLNKYFLYAKKKFINESKSRSISSPINHINSFTGFYVGQFIKCYTIDFVLKSNWLIKTLYFQYDVQKLMNDWLNTNRSSMKFYFKMHLNDQFLVGGFPIFDFLSKKSMRTNIYLQGFEVLKNRNSRNRKCADTLDSYGTTIIHYHLVRKICRPPYLNKNESVELCNNAENMKNSKFNYEAHEEMKMQNPCQRISQTILFIHTIPTKYNSSAKWLLMINYPKEFKIIKQHKEVDIHSLIGNIGGYLGLFMGKSSI